MVTRSDRLDHVHSDIRGPLYQEALRMESEGINVLKLNTGNPGRFGFKLPNSVRQALALHIDEAVPYCDVRGMAAARNVICTYHIGRGLQGIMPNDSPKINTIYIFDGTSFFFSARRPMRFPRKRAAQFAAKQKHSPICPSRTSWSITFLTSFTPVPVSLTCSKRSSYRFIV